MKRLLPFFLLLGAAAARAQTAPDAKLRAERQELKAAGTALLGALLPFVPPKYALDTLAPQTFSKGPYRAGDPGYINAGSRAGSFTATGSVQLIERGGRADHALGQLRTESRIGFDFQWSAYEARALQTFARSDIFAAHLTTSLLEREDFLFESGFGGATIQRDDSEFGASWVFNFEAFRKKPWILGARYVPSIYLDGRVFHELRAEAGAAWGRAALTAGVRALLNPLRNAVGPEASLKLWF